MPDKKKSRPAQKVPLDYANKKAKVTVTPITKKEFDGSVKRGAKAFARGALAGPTSLLKNLKKIKKIEFKRFSRLGLGRGFPGDPGMKRRKEGVPFERGSLGLRKKAREKTRTSKSQVGSATGEKRELKRQNKKRQSNRGSTRR
jgi:hypothetical protein